MVMDKGAASLYDFTSLMGSDKKIMLKKWPETSATAIKIWRV